jgi:predicted GH43/DUF377 family glycosyl hydrolase
VRTARRDRMAEVKVLLAGVAAGPGRHEGSKLRKLKAESIRTYQGQSTRICRDSGAGWCFCRRNEPRRIPKLVATVFGYIVCPYSLWEKLTQYKSNIIHDKDKSLGYPFVMFYNGKTKSGYERIGMAVSKDMKSWLRYGKEPVIDNGKGISGDPQITRIGDVWVMFYFGAFYKPKAFDTFACSYDLVKWTKWTGKHLVEPSTKWDQKYAHKPWVVTHNGVVYHFYCAVGNQGRVIALATSKDLKPETKNKSSVRNP